MKDYIKREDAIFIVLQQPIYSVVTQIKQIDGIDLDDYVPREFHDKTCEAMAKRHQKEIEDMVSVVRCKECKYWLSDKPIKNKWFQNGEVDQCKWRTDESPNADDYCSYGERSE